MTHPDIKRRTLLGGIPVLALRPQTVLAAGQDERPIIVFIMADDLS